MAHHASAKKRIRQTAKRTLRNRIHRSQLRTQVRRFHAAVDEGNVAAARTELDAAIVRIAKTRSRGVLHANTAARRISRLQQRFNKLVAGEPTSPPARKSGKKSKKGKRR